MSATTLDPCVETYETHHELPPRPNDSLNDFVEEAE
jgi:hypothetical protein